MNSSSERESNKAQMSLTQKFVLAFLCFLENFIDIVLNPLNLQSLMHIKHLFFEQISFQFEKLHLSTIDPSWPTNSFEYFFLFFHPSPSMWDSFCVVIPHSPVDYRALSCKWLMAHHECIAGITLHHCRKLNKFSHLFSFLFIVLFLDLSFFCAGCCYLILDIDSFNARFSRHKNGLNHFWSYFKEYDVKDFAVEVNTLSEHLKLFCHLD